jgi:hypothetical protein
MHCVFLFHFPCCVRPGAYVYVTTSTVIYLLVERHIPPSTSGLLKSQSCPFNRDQSPSQPILGQLHSPSSKRNEEETKREETKKTTDAAPNLLTANRSSGVHLQSVLPLLFFSFPADPFRALQQVLPVVGPIIRLVCGDGSPRSSIP